ncbi:beta-lactamase/transpeptidase-like protein [Mycena sp. CBHHK59/15]|nr:beta-lactamase/transpeptidase-like protein [Mycena sp. CBHHK59/15]
MRLFYILGLVLTGVCAPADNTQILNSNVDAFINGVLADWNSAAGAAVAVVHLDGQGGWLIETKGYGIAKGDGTKVGPDTIFSLGSNSKASSLSHWSFDLEPELEPQISWTTKIASVIPDWKLMDPVASSESTITDLMGHCRVTISPIASPTTFCHWQVKRLRYLKPSTGFRENPQYNNIMYAVLSHLPTALLPHKPPFARYVKEHIPEPLGLNPTTHSFAVTNATGNFAVGFAREGINVSENPVGAGTTRVLPYFLPNVTEDGNGGVLSSAVDIARWLQMLLLKGQHLITNATIIPADMIQKVATGITVWEGTADTPELSPVVYGGRTQVQSSYRGHVMIEHGGDVEGFPSQITRFPNDGLGVAVLTNDDAFGTLFKEVIKYRIVDEVFGLPVSQFAAGAARPSNPTPPAQPLAALAWTYRNLGYGADIELCATGKVAASYVTLAHFDGALFNVSGWIATATGNASAPYWAYDAGLEGNTAQFAFGTGGAVQGFGITGGIWGAGSVEGEPQGAGVEGMSEVWFAVV